MGRHWDDWRKSRARVARRRRRTDSWFDWAGVGCDGCEPDGCDLGCSLLGLVPHLVVVVAGAFRASAVDPFSAPHGPAAVVASRLVRSYQVNVSARRSLPVCNLSPSCSRYGLEVLAGHGVIRGAPMIRARIRECGRAGRAL